MKKDGPAKRIDQIGDMRGTLCEMSFFNDNWRLLFGPTNRLLIAVYEMSNSFTFHRIKEENDRQWKGAS